VICKRSEQGRWLERNMRETGSGEAERRDEIEEECPGVCQRYGKAPSQALAHESGSSKVQFYFIYLFSVG
jgi:hypothetical protein